MKISVGAVGLTVCAIYFGYHSFAGEQGLFSWREMQVEIQQLEAQKAALESRRDALHNQIERLSPSTLDLDYVEELARRKLNYVYPGELVMTDPQISYAPKKS